MRSLHKVAAHEGFVASGTYRYYRDEQLIPVTEQWTIHSLAGGAFLYRVDEDGRDEDGLNILSEALISLQGKIERYNVQSFNPRDPEIKLFKADYTFYDTYVQIGRKLAGEEHEYDEFSLVEDAIPYIRQTLFMGGTIRDVLRRDSQRAHVFSPQLISSETSQMQRLQVQLVEEEMLQVGRKTVLARKIQIADDVFYWLDEHDIPLRRQYTHEGIIYQARLGDYAHR